MLMLLTTGLEVMLILYHYTDTNDKNKGNPLHSIELAFPHSS